MDEQRRRSIDALDRERSRFREHLAELDDQVEIYPSWRIRDVLAHLAGWDQVSLQALSAFAAGEPVALLEQDVDAVNADFCRAWQGLDLEAAVADWEAAREQLKAAIIELPAGLLSQPFPYPWGGKGTVIQLANGLAIHEKEHAQEIRERLLQA